MPDNQEEVRRVYQGLQDLNQSNQRNLDRYKQQGPQGQLGNADWSNARMYQREVEQNQKAIAELEADYPWLLEGAPATTPSSPTLMDKAQGYGAMGLVGLAKFLGWPVAAIQQMGRDPLPPAQKEQGEGIGPAFRNWAKEMGRPTIVDHALEYTGLTPWAERQAEEAQMGPWGKFAAELLGMGAGGVGAGKMATKGLQKLMGKPPAPPAPPPPTTPPTKPLPWKPIVPENVQQPVVPSTPSMPAPGAASGVSVPQTVTKNVQQVVSPFDDAMVEAAKALKAKGKVPTPENIADYVKFDPRFHHMKSPDFDQQFGEAVERLQQRGLFKPIPATETPIIGDELWQAMRRRFEAETGTVARLDGSVMSARDKVTGELLHSADLNDPKELQTMLKALGLMESEGVTLGSLFGALDKPTRDLASKIGKTAPTTARAIKAVTQDLPQTMSQLWRSATEYLERPQFYFRKTKEGRQIAEAASQAEANATAIMRNTLYHQTDEGLEQTRYFIYDSLDDAVRSQVDEALVEGDKLGVVFSRAELAQRGLNDIQIDAYEGVRAVMDRIWKRASVTNQKLEQAGLKPLGVADEEGMVGLGQRAGYIPRKWFGDWEIYVRDPQTGDLSKYIRPNVGSSSFVNKARANYEVQLLQKDPAYAGKEFVVQQFTRKVPSYAAHGMERHGAQGYETANLRDVLRQYVAQEARWEANAQFRIDYDQIIKGAKDALSPEELARLDRFFMRAMGKPQWLDMKADEWLNSIPVVKDLVKTSDPTRQLTSGIRGWVTHSSLGMLNFGYSVVNAMAVSQHVYPATFRYASQLGKKLGIKIDNSKIVREAIGAYFKGMKHRFAGGEYTPEAKLMDELVHRGIVDIQYWTESAPSVSGKLLGSENLRKGVELMKETSLFLGRSTEEFSRVVAAISGYNLAGRAGMNHEAALKFAQKFTDETMVRFGRATKPGIYAGQVGGTFGQFRSFQQAMVENLYSNTFEGSLKSAMRAWGTTIGMGGVAGLPGAVAFDRAYTQLTGTSPLEEFTRSMKNQVGVGMAATTGAMSEIPGMIGMEDWNVDLSGRVGIGPLVPSGIDDFAFYNKIIEPLTEVFVHADPQSALRAMHLNAPGLNYYLNTREDEAGNTVYLDKRGTVLYRPEGGQVALESVGLMPQERGDIYRFGHMASNKRQHALEENRDYYEAVSRGKVPEEKPKSVTAGGLKRSLKSRKTPKEQRIMKKSYKHLRRDLVNSPLRPSKLQ